MTTTGHNETDGYQVKVDPAGRVVVPAAIRERHHIQAGDTLVIRSRDDALELRTYDQVIREAQNYFCSLLPAGRSLTRELIEERRRDADAE